MRFDGSILLRVAAVCAVLSLMALSPGFGASAIPVSSGVNLANLDRTCAPCADFYQFANGGWLARTPIPADRSQFGSFSILSDNNEDVLHGILDEVATSNPPAGSNERKIADYYNSCMNTAAIERGGLSPLAADMAAIDAMRDTSELPALVAKLQIDDFTPEQRFFLGWANVFASLTRPETIKLYAATDVHAYDKFRVNATMSNMPSFAQAWRCPLSAAMVKPPARRCQIW